MDDSEKLGDTPKILMIGPSRDVRGGISAVVNSYYSTGLDKKVYLKYIPTMEDGSKLKKMMVAVSAYLKYCVSLRRADIVHIHMAAQASFTRKSFFVKKAKKAGKKIIIHQHAADFDDFFFKQSNENRKKKIKEIFSMADRVIALSEEWAGFYAENVCDQEKIVVIHNSVIAPGQAKEDYRNKNVLFLGKLGRRKGVYDLLKAAAGVVKKCPDAHFYLCGDGDIRGCREIIDKNGLSGNFELPGWVNSVQKEQYFRKCSMFILPSYHEGMPMAVLEAMAHGLATISTNAGGIPQVIVNKSNGIRIEAGDIPGIRDALLSLLMNPEEKRRIGYAGRETVITHFNAAQNIDAITGLYQSML